jgi:O-antigen/teichoic acid export membrane protein
MFFAREDANYAEVNWKFPWLIVMFATSITLLCSPYFSIIEGMGKILDVAKFRMTQMFISYAVLILTLNLGIGLYSLALFQLSGAVCSALWLIGNSKNRSILFQVYASFKKEHQINWRNEIFPLQWKIALSWLSGYFIFQLMNPLLFAYKGPVAAGQMGMTLAVFGGLSVVSMAWINTKVPTFSMLVAKKQFTQLDEMFFRTLKQASLIAVSIILIGWVALYMLHLYLPKYGSRFLPPVPIAFVAANSLFNQLIFALAIYLRSHKKEPLLLPSIMGAICSAAIAFICAKWFTVFELTLSFLIIGIVIFLPWNIKIFLSNREKWHTKPKNDFNNSNTDLQQAR